MRKKLQEAIMSAPDLPTGFTECEYLENNGTQRINTGIIAQDDMSFEYQFIFEEYGNSYLPLFGNSTATGRLAVGMVAYSITVVWGVKTQVGAFYLQAGTEYHMNVSRAECTLTGGDKTKTFALNEGTLSGETQTVRIGEAPWFGNSYYTIKHKHFAIKQEEQTILDLIPVLDADDIPCMYDKISRTCFYNSGKGTFGYKIKATGETVAPKST